MPGQRSAVVGGGIVGAAVSRRLLQGGGSTPRCAPTGGTS